MMKEVNNWQSFIDLLALGRQSERAKSQMTLGDLVSFLEKIPDYSPVPYLTYAHSYRGYYEDLAFEVCDGTMPAKQLLEEAKSIIGEVFEGYKGGEFKMYADTPVWIANYGDTGKKLIAIEVGGGIKTAENTD